MRRILLVMAVAALMAAMMALSGGPAFADPGGNGNGCGVGFAVAPATQTLGGIGDAAHDAGLKDVGHLIQQGHDFVKEDCHA